MMAAAGGGGEGGDSAIQLPIIDLSPMMREGGGTADELEAIGAQMREACTTEGIFYVSGHGVEERKLNGALQASKSFFSLPQQEKELVTCPPGRGRGFTRGYIEMGGESGSDRLEVSVHSATKHRPHPCTLGDGRRFDFCHHIWPVFRHPFSLCSLSPTHQVKEAFSFGYEWPEGASHESWTNSLQGPNSWPSETGVLDPEEWNRACKKYGGDVTWKEVKKSDF